MTQLRRQLHQTSPSAVSNSWDRWFLVFDTDKCLLHVEHSWENVEARRGGALYQGSVRMELGEFLRQGGQEPVKRELERVLTSVFEEQFSAEVTL